MVELYTQEVLDDLESFVEMEFNANGLIRKKGFRLVVGLCSDGMMVTAPAVNLQGKPTNLIMISISAELMGRIPNAPLNRYFQKNRVYATQTLAQFAEGATRASLESSGVN
jgi:hypothetical protein